MCSARGFPHARIGVTGGAAVEVQGQFGIGLDELRAAWTSTLPELFED